MDGFCPDRDSGARFRCDFQFCRVCSIGHARRPKVLSPLARSKIPRITWLGLCRSSGLGIFRAIVAGQPKPATILFAVSAVAIGLALRLAERPHGRAKTHDIHPSFPTFIRLTYVWLIVA